MTIKDGKEESVPQWFPYVAFVSGCIFTILGIFWKWRIHNGEPFAYLNTFLGLGMLAASVLSIRREKRCRVFAVAAGIWVLVLGVVWVVLIAAGQ